VYVEKANSAKCRWKEKIRFKVNKKKKCEGGGRGATIVYRVWVAI
jgi:hypothetical protein